MDQQLYDISQKLEDIRNILSNYQDQSIEKSRRKEENFKQIAKNSKNLVSIVGLIGVFVLALTMYKIWDPNVSAILIAAISTILSAAAFSVAMMDSSK